MPFWRVDGVQCPPRSVSPPEMNRFSAEAGMLARRLDLFNRQVRSPVEVDRGQQGALVTAAANGEFAVGIVLVRQVARVRRCLSAAP